MQSEDGPDGGLSESRELLARVRDGDRVALGGLYDRYGARLLERIRLMMGAEARRRAESGDFLNGVFVELAGKAQDTFPETEEQFLRWATAIARNDVRDQVRRRREASLESLSSALAAVPPADGEEGLASAVAQDEFVLHLVSALAQLDPDHRLVIELWDLESLPAEEVARRLGRSPDAVRMLRHRALLRLGKLVRRK